MILYQFDKCLLQIVRLFLRSQPTGAPLPGGELRRTESYGNIFNSSFELINSIFLLVRVPSQESAFPLLVGVPQASWRRRGVAPLCHRKTSCICLFLMLIIRNILFSKWYYTQPTIMSDKFPHGF